MYAGNADPPPTSWFIDLSRFAASAHGTQNCEACHGTMKVLDKRHPDLKDPQFLKREASRKYDYQRCQTCHRSSYEQYLKGAHARALQKEKEQSPPPTNLKENPAPTCGDCHASHYEKAHRSRLDVGRSLTEVCGSCHQAQKIAYLDNFHGKAAVNLGNTKAAYCTDCHGAHDCLSLKDRKTALKSCQRCHPQANLSFAGMVIHPTLEAGKEKNSEKEAKVAVIQLITVVMGTLVLVVVVFFYGHSFLWLLREIHEKLKRRQRALAASAYPNNYYTRFSVLHRFLHWVVMLGFIGLGLTGFSHKYGSQFWAQGVAFILGGQEWLGYWHRFWAVITYSGVVIHLGWLVYYKTLLKGRLTGPQTIFPRGKDLSDLYQHIRYFLGRGKTPKFDRFTYWEKVDYWAILVGMNTMGLTGLVMWFPEFFAAVLPGYFINLAQVIHLYEAIMAVALKFVIHIVTAHLRPEIYPMDRVIFSGQTTLERMKIERPGEWEFLIWGLKGEAAAAVVEEGLPDQEAAAPPKEEESKSE